MELNKIKILFLFASLYILKCKKKVAVIGLDHSQNIGNNLLKYAMYIKLKSLGFLPIMIGKLFENHNISFLTKTTNVRLIKNFSEIKSNEYDFLIVNSDQTWRKWDENFYDIAFLNFSEKWKIHKFVYGASLGYEEWKLSEEDTEIAKRLLKNFSGISVRERYAVGLIKRFLGFKAQYVLDPTFLINKKYYLNLIKNYQSENIKDINENFIFSYIIMESDSIKNYINYVKTISKLKIFYINIYNNNQVMEFLYGIINCKAVITDSFHGTVFSLLFKKPFISFLNEGNDYSRFNNLDEIFNIKNRIFDLNSIPPVSLLFEPIKFNESKLRSLRKGSLDYLKKNLLIK